MHARPGKVPATVSHTSLAQLAAQILGHWAVPHRHTGAAGLTSWKRTRRLCIICDSSNRLTASYFVRGFTNASRSDLQTVHSMTSLLGMPLLGTCCSRAAVVSCARPRGSAGRASVDMVVSARPGFQRGRPGRSNPISPGGWERRPPGLSGGMKDGLNSTQKTEQQTHYLASIQKHERLINHTNRA